MYIQVLTLEYSITDLLGDPSLSVNKQSITV